MKTIFHRIIRSIYFKAFFLAILTQGFFVFSAFAQGPTNPPTGGSSGGFGFENPLRADSLGGLINALLGLIVQLSVPVIAVFIIYAGFLFVSAGGSEEKLKKAKSILWYTIVGAAIILGAQVISGIITGTLLSL